MQEIVVYTIIGICTVIIVIRAIRFFTKKNDGCNCGCSDTTSCKSACNACKNNSKDK